MKVICSEKIITTFTDYEVDGIARDCLEWYGYRRKYDRYWRFTNTYYKGDGILIPHQIIKIYNNHEGTVVIEAVYKPTILCNSKKHIEQLTRVVEKLSLLLKGRMKGRQSTGRSAGGQTDEAAN